MKDMIVLNQFLTDPHTCPYLADRTAVLEYTYALSLSPQEYEDLMNKGYRKFGGFFFQPLCGACTACRPLRVPVDRFKMNRSQRRVMKMNSDLEVRFAPPRVDNKRLDLYDRYHRWRHETRAWSEQPAKDREDYAISFVKNPIPSIEISVWEGKELCGVIINDITPTTVSGIYHFHDPKKAERCLGTFCVLLSFELARRLQKPWVYLGYYVEGCGSLAYKARYQPCEILDEKGEWVALPAFSEKTQGV